MDYSDLLDQLRTASIDVLYVGGYSPEAGLIIRQARDREYNVQLVAGDLLSTGEFWLVAGPAGEGALFTSFSDPTPEPRAAEVMGRLQARLQQPNARALYSYAAAQLWAQAVEKAGTTDAAPVAQALRQQQFDTVLGTHRVRRQGRRHRLRSVRLVRLDRRQVRGEGPDRLARRRVGRWELRRRCPRCAAAAVACRSYGCMFPAPRRGPDRGCRRRP